MEVVTETYEIYLRHGPLDRPAIRPRQPSELPQQQEDIVNFHSCELKLRGLLLHLVPDDVKKPCLKTRATSTMDILYQAHVSAGPGTGPDREVTLAAVSKGKPVPLKSIYDELQEWKFALTRLATLGVAPPDPSVQVKALC